MPTKPPGVPPTITCVDCGEQCHLLTTWPDDDPPYPGDIVSYRCSGCNDRWDIELPEVEEESGEW